MDINRQQSFDPELHNGESCSFSLRDNGLKSEEKEDILSFFDIVNLPIICRIYSQNYLRQLPPLSFLYFKFK